MLLLVAWKPKLIPVAINQWLYCKQGVLCNGEASRLISELSRCGFHTCRLPSSFFGKLHFNGCSLCCEHSIGKRSGRDTSGLDLSGILVATSYAIFLLALQPFHFDFGSPCKSFHPIIDADQKPQWRELCQLFWVLCHSVGEKTHPEWFQKQIHSW